LTPALEAGVAKPHITASWLAFKARVLAQARDSCHPLLERVKVLVASGTNLDEVFMIRVAARASRTEVIDGRFARGSSRSPL
jgi:polyphosphate kinase